MPPVTVTVPGLLARFTGGRRSIPVRADTVDECLGRLIADYPALEPHLFGTADRPRAHLKLFHNGTPVTWGDAAVTALMEGDEVIVLQAVSGG